MSSVNNGRIAWNVSTELESRVVARFKEIYVAAGEPEGMALFSHYVEGQTALSITAKSVPYATSLFTLLEWSEYDSRRPFGAVGWLAGDSRLRVFASTVFISVSEAIQRDEELSSGKVTGRTHEEVMRAARDALEAQPRSG